MENDIGDSNRYGWPFTPLALPNAGLIVATWPRSPKLTGLVTFIVCGGSVLLAYRENPASFHREVGRTEALRIIFAPIIAVGILILLGLNHLL